jgi:hypothetical protein
MKQLIASTKFANGGGLNNHIHQMWVKSSHFQCQLLVCNWQIYMFSFVKIGALVLNNIIQ